MADITNQQEASRRLRSWKEIAAFFGKDERTVKRWESDRGLPVRRVPRGTRSSVFAYTAELEAWLNGAPVGVAAAARPAAPPRAARARPVPALAAIALAIALGSAALVQTFGWSAGHAAPAAAVTLYERGVVDWNSRTAEGLGRAIDELTQATTIDPAYAKAFAGLANAYNLLSQYTGAPADESYARGKAAAERAIALDPRLAEGYAALAFNRFYGSHAFAEAGRLFDTAIELDPNASQTLHWAALTRMHLGDFATPLRLISRAEQLNPDSRSIRANKALILFYAGEADEGVALLTELKQAHPDYLATPSYLATVFLAEGRDAEFLDAYAQAAEVEHNAARTAIAARARAGYATGGHNGLLTAMLAEQMAQHGAGVAPAYPAAVTAAMLGDRDTALRLLEEAVAKGESDVLSLRIERAFAPLRTEPRFRALLSAVGLPLPA